MKSVHRLFDAFMPKHYDLRLTIEREKRHFNGTVTLTGVSERAGNISLHAKGLTILDAYVDEIRVKATEGEHDSLILHSDTDHGEHTVRITFSGTITDSMHGLYPGYYEHNDNKKEILVTQFESHHAREVFPCIDEPEAKAIFELTIETEKDVQVLSNTAIASKVHTAKTTISRFEKTPRMSTYLLAFVIGELHRVHQTTTSGVEVSVYATQTHPLSSLEFALDIAVRGIEFFEDYFDTPYPLTKCDHVAIPDFSAGAMENWGLITYRERVLVANETASQSAKELIASVICHELSHQWFGNLVTMRWWDDLWLNESFANMMEYVAVDALEPSWDIWQTFASKEITSALSRDYLAGVQPVKVVVRHPDEISTIFDPAIVYAKGSRLLAMLQQYIGDSSFRHGLQHYFQTHGYGNTSSSDLWRSLAVHSHKDIDGLMDSWLQQAGFPVIDVTTTPEGYSLRQQRMVVGTHPDERLWTIPLLPYQSDFPELLKTRKASFNANHNFPYINKGGSSHFISRYDDAAFARVLVGLRENKLTSVERLSLLFETILLAKCNETPVTHILTVMSEFANDTTESVWAVMAHGISEIRRFVENTEDEDTLNSFINDITKIQFSRLTSTERSNDTDSDKKLRAVICNLRLSAKDAVVIDECLTVAKSKKLTTLHGELRGVIYNSVAMYGSAEQFASLLSIHNTTTDPLLKSDVIDGLTSTSNQDHIAVLLHHMTDTGIVKPQDTVRWFIGLMKNSSARQPAWEWMVHHWKFIVATFHGDKIYESFARYSAATLNTQEEYKAYKDFFEPKQNDIALERSITIGLHELKNRVAVITHNKQAVVSDLQERALSIQ